MNKSNSRSKSFKKHPMFSSVAAAPSNLNQNQITDDQNYEFRSQRKTREEIDKAYKSLNKGGDDSDDGGRTNSMSRDSIDSNDNGNTTEMNSLFDSSQDNVKVCIRVRPLNNKEQ